MLIKSIKPGLSDYNSVKRTWLLMAIIFSVICLVSTALHYTGAAPGNPFTWLAWIISVVFIFSYAIEFKGFKKDLSFMKSKRLWFYLTLTVLFFVSHLWNYHNLPWNDKGLFDDGAWDIYFSKKYIFSGQPFQAAFFDQVGYISREVVFHYFITFFFKLFGYNLLIFNIALTVLGYITFIFTTLLAERLFKNKYVTIVTAIVFNFLPLRFMHTYAGHRYAIAAPMIMASFYFTYTGFHMKSKVRLVLGALFAAFAVDSSVMGKQYLYGIIFGSIIVAIIYWKEIMKKEMLKRVLLYTTFLIICMMPVIMYVAFNHEYFGHEKDLTSQFMKSVNIDMKNEGSFAYIKLPFALGHNIFNYSQASEEFKNYVSLLNGTFLDKDSGVKWFIPGFVALPTVYFIFLLPGIIIAIMRRHYAIVLLAAIPVVGAFVAGSADYRVLHGAPFWIILMAFSLSSVIKINDIEIEAIKKYKLGYVAFALCALIVSVGLFQSIGYIYKIASNPNSLNMLPHRDVEIARYMKDVVAGVNDPSTKMRWNELNTGLTPSSKYDTLLCQLHGYAITHVFLKDFDDKKIMAFSDQLPFNLLSESEIFNINKNAIKGYDSSSGKDLKLIWESEARTVRIISAFKSLEKYGSGEKTVLHTDNGDIEFYTLNVTNNNINKLKEELDSIVLK